VNIIEIASDPKADPGPTHYPVYLKPSAILGDDRWSRSRKPATVFVEQ
jgi:hypothetical protein